VHGCINLHDHRKTLNIQHIATRVIEKKKSYLLQTLIHLVSSDSKRGDKPEATSVLTKALKTAE
jgi:hypothetical protein